MNIVCSELAVGYHGVALHSPITFTIPSGAYVCVVGENGAGKSTFIKTLLGLLPPIAGSVRLESQEKKPEIGYLPQQTQAQKDFPASVYEVVLSGCLNSMGWRPFYSKKEKALVQKTLERLNIAHICHRSYNELSGGQQQRVLLARALCATREVLLLDEPTAGLDSVTIQEFYTLIKSLNDDGITIIMITHALHEPLPYAHFILSMGTKGVSFMSKDLYKQEAGL